MLFRALKAGILEYLFLPFNFYIVFKYSKCTQQNYLFAPITFTFIFVNRGARCGIVIISIF